MTIRWITLAASIFVLAACSSGSGTPAPPAGTLALTIVDRTTGTGIAEARVIVVEGDTGESIDLLFTDENGQVSETYEVGTFQLRISKQDYAPSPPSGIPALPVQIVDAQTTAITVSIDPLAAADRGWISGLVTDGAGQPASGALIVATASDGSNLSTTTFADGRYVIHNVPAGPATLDAFLGGQNFDSAGPASVTADANVEQNITAAGAAFGEIFGHVSFTSVSGDIIDITLLHPETRDVLPNLSVTTDDGGNYDISGVPVGDFEIIASLENDGFVLDPDTSVTQGIPTVTITELAPVIANMDFKVTGSIDSSTPGPIVDADVPELGDQPTFTWSRESSFASADYYVIEVVDESGETIWGGFDAANNFAPRVTVPQATELSVSYNFDGTASLALLEDQRYYQLRLYAAVIDASEVKGFRLLSASETLAGIFRVATP